jgi:hypothetical protein
MPSKTLLGGSSLLLLLTSAAPLAAQVLDTATVYRREVFDYARGGRTDPFRSLLNTAELGIRFEDLSLRGVIYNPDPRLSVAVFWEAGAERRIRARVGERVGGIKILAIHPRRVDLLIEEFGVARRESLDLKRDPEKGSEA